MKMMPDMPVKGPDIIGIGECMVEFHASESFFDAGSVEKRYGGDVLNALVHASRLGSRTAFVTKVGDDPFGDYLLAAWRREAVDTSHAPLVEGANGVYFVSVDADGERQFTYRREHSPASQLAPDDIDEVFIRSGRCLLVSGITQAISSSASAAVERAVRCMPADSLVCFDPNYRPALWARRNAVAREAYLRIISRVDWLLPSYPADLALLGDGDYSPREALRAFAKEGHNVALKMGAEGVLLWIDGIEVSVPATVPEKVIDTTGAGDAWNGAFLSCILKGTDPVEAAVLGNRYAARKLAFRGAAPPSWLADGTRETRSC